MPALYFYKIAYFSRSDQPRRPRKTRTRWANWTGRPGTCSRRVLQIVATTDQSNPIVLKSTFRLSALIWRVHV